MFTILNLFCFFFSLCDVLLDAIGAVCHQFGLFSTFLNFGCAGFQLGLLVHALPVQGHQCPYGQTCNRCSATYAKCLSLMFVQSIWIKVEDSNERQHLCLILMVVLSHSESCHGGAQCKH